MRTVDLDFVRLRVLASALAGIAACAGETESLGTTGMMSISASWLGSDGPPCAAGAAHRNACCRTTGTGNTECGTYPRSPLHACGAEWTTVPVANTCCDLADATQCGAPPAPPSTGACVYVCPPGYAAQGSITRASGTCCAAGTSGGEPCFAWWNPVDAGPEWTSCDTACPSGFTRTAAAPDVCFANNPFGAPDETVPNPVGATSSATSDGAECALSGGAQGGHSYSLQCSNVTQICTCGEDSITTTVAGVLVCQANGNAALVDLWVQGCGFPR